MNNFSSKYIGGLREVLDSFPHDEFDQLTSAMLDAREKGRHIFTMGNGGSASTASHWACDINKGCCVKGRNRFRMICLNDSLPTLLAYANDLTYEDVFVEQLKNFFEPGDLVIGISGSGNSENVLRAIDYANENNGTTAGLCGYSGGKLRDRVRIPLWAEVDDMQKVEDIHMIIVHMNMQNILQELSDDRSTD